MLCHKSEIISHYSNVQQNGAASNDTCSADPKACSAEPATIDDIHSWHRGKFLALAVNSTAQSGQHSRIVLVGPNEGACLGSRAITICVTVRRNGEYVLLGVLQAQGTHQAIHVDVRIPEIGSFKANTVDDIDGAIDAA